MRLFVSRPLIKHFELNVQEKAKMASTVGLEPTTPGLEVRCAIHCATLTDGYPPNFSLFKDLGKLGKFIYFFHLVLHGFGTRR